MFTKVARFSIQQNETLKQDILEMKKYFVLKRLHENSPLDFGPTIDRVDFDQIQITFGIGLENYRVHKKGQHPTEYGLIFFEQLPKL